MKKLWITAMLLLLVFAVILQMNRPQLVTWQPDFRSASNNPFGLSAFYEILPKLFPSAGLYRAELSNFEESWQSGVVESKNYLAIAEKFSPEYASSQALLDHVFEGNYAFIAAGEFGGEIPDVLGFRVGKRYPGRTAHPAGDYFSSTAWLGVDSTAAGLDTAAAAADTLRAADSASGAADTAAASQDSEAADADSADTETSVFDPLVSGILFTSRTDINLVNPLLSLPEPVYYQKIAGWQCFTEIDTLSAEYYDIAVLGRNSYGEANFLRIRWGDGYFFVSTLPFAYSNYNILHAGGAQYVANAVSYLPERDIYWDGHESAASASPDSMGAIGDNPALSAAVTTAIFAIILFGIFSIKRRQRIIPIVQAPANATLEFVRMVGDLYHQRADNAGAAHKKIRFLLEHIRRRYYLRTDVLDLEFRKLLALKSGQDLEVINDLFRTIDRALKRNSMSSDQLIDICNQIDTFYYDSQT